MKKCDEIRELIYIYVDGELDEAQRAEFEEHINSCADCRNELDEIKSIISMCNSIEEEELPDNFREELHSKLLAVKEENMRKNKVVTLRNRYIRIISAVAACLLIVVLARGFLYDSFFPKYGQKDMDKTGSARENAGTLDEGAEIYGFSAENNDAADSIAEKGSGIAEEEIQQFSIMADPNTAEAMPGDSGITVSRSTEPGQRKHELQKSDEENVYSNNVIINAKVKGELDSEVQNIRKLAVDSGGEFSEETAQIAMANARQETDGKKATETVLNFKISYNQYQNLFDSLTEYVGSGNITADKVSQDMSNIIESYNARLSEIEDEISGIEKSGNASTSSPDVLKTLNEERQLIINEIEKIKLDSDYIYVTIYIQQNDAE
ncbi:MAG TPA: hypothetical protein GXX36_00800 [Clostridiaceae bacterium]|nr:hypothetical protein [Clostridiaceae bacterium]